VVVTTLKRLTGTRAGERRPPRPGRNGADVPSRKRWASTRVVEREVEIGGKSVPIFDAVGKDTVLFHHSVSDDDRATGSQYVDQARRWFDSLWGTLGRTYEP
jgi:hypothetical protein